MREMLSAQHGLFLSKDGGRTLQPNPHAALAVGGTSLPSLPSFINIIEDEKLKPSESIYYG